MTPRPAPIKIGDIFTLPVDANRVGLGQVVDRYRRDGWYFAVFDQVINRSEGPNLGSVDRLPLVFLALSLDAKLAVGDWEIIGNCTPAPTLRAQLPAYKEATGLGSIDIVDYSGDRRRAASADEIDSYPYRKVVAPVRFENALKAKVGISEWLDAYDVLLPTGRTSEQAFE